MAHYRDHSWPLVWTARHDDVLCSNNLKGVASAFQVTVVTGYPGIQTGEPLRFQLYGERQ